MGESFMWTDPKWICNSENSCRWRCWWHELSDITLTSSLISFPFPQNLVKWIDIDDRRFQRLDICHLMSYLTSQSTHDLPMYQGLHSKIGWYHGCDVIRTPGGAKSMQRQWWLPSSLLFPALTWPSQDPGPLGAWVPLITHSSLRIDACTLWNLHNRSDTNHWHC